MLTVGVFDGVHRGHLPILRKVVAQARRLRGTSVALTFDGHPTQLVSPQYSPPLLVTTAQKLKLLEETGLDAVLLLKFDRAFASIQAEEFISRILVKRLGIKELVVGYDFVFGRQGLGNIDLLKEASRTHGFRLSVTGPVNDHGAPVSSTRIRSAILAGNMAEAARLLGRPYRLCGKVVGGDQRGRVLGYPTANLNTEQELLPKAGVWGGRVRLVGQVRPVGSRTGWIPFLANLGTRPTFGPGGKMQIELHLLGFQGSLYGTTLEAEFQHYLRPEKKFSGPAALKAQIGRDRMVFDRWRRQGRPT